MVEHKQYVYVVGYTFTLRGERGERPCTGRLDITSTEPATTGDQIDTWVPVIANILRDENPGWDAAFPGWRYSISILACSLLRIEVQRDGEWVLAEQQPWGAVTA